MGCSGAAGLPRGVSSSAHPSTRAALTPCRRPRRPAPDPVDKQNTFIGILLLIAAVILFVYGQKHSLQPPSPAEIRHEVTTQTALQENAPAAQPSGPEPAFATAQAEHVGASVT